MTTPQLQDRPAPAPAAPARTGGHLRIGSAVALPVRRVSVVVALVLLVLTVLAAVATLSFSILPLRPGQSHAR